MLPRKLGIWIDGLEMIVGIFALEESLAGSGRT